MRFYSLSSLLHRSFVCDFVCAKECIAASRKMNIASICFASKTRRYGSSNIWNLLFVSKDPLLYEVAVSTAVGALHSSEWAVVGISWALKNTSFSNFDKLIKHLNRTHAGNKRICQLHYKHCNRAIYVARM